MDAQQSPNLLPYIGLISHLQQLSVNTIVCNYLSITLTEHMVVYGNAGCGVGQTCDVTFRIFFIHLLVRVLYMKRSVCSADRPDLFSLEQLWNVHLTQTT